MNRSAIRLLFINAVFTTIISCNDKGEPRPSCYLTSENDNTLGILLGFQYDGKVMNASSTTLLSGNSTLFDMQYDNYGKLTTITANDRPVSTFTYDDNEIIKQEIYDGSDIIRIETYEYSSGRLTNRRSYSVTDGTQVEIERRTFVYTDDSKNISRVMVFTPGTAEPSLTIDYTYGDQHAPHGAATPEIIKYFRVSGIPVDNIVLRKVFSGGNVYDYSYTFNEHGYPLKETLTISSHAVSVTQNTNYTYSCN